MPKTNPVFERNYQRYLKQLDLGVLERKLPMLGLSMDKDGRQVEVPFFNRVFLVSKKGVTDGPGQYTPYAHYGISVILLKYLLMCPDHVAAARDWVHFREFTDAGTAQDAGLAEYAVRKIAQLFSGRLAQLKQAVAQLGGRPPESDFPYDCSAVFQVLPKLPLLFLFNDADGQFPAWTTILYERRAEFFLDAECRVMVDWCLLKLLETVDQGNLKEIT